MKRNRRQAFTLVEIMIVVLIIGILMTIAVPNFIQARQTSRKNSCIANLRQIDSAKEQFAMENMMDTGDSASWTNLVPTYMNSQPTCPGGGTYTVGVIGTDPTCSLSTSGHVLD